MARHVFTHVGVLRGDARTSGRQFRTRLRKTPSGSHWVDEAGRKYRPTGGGYVGDKWPMYFLDASTIEARRAETPQSGSVEDESVVPQADAQKGSS